jgi:hypothetical protein
MRNQAWRNLCYAPGRRVAVSNFIQVTPFMVVDDIERALTFFTHRLGFKTLLRYPDYAYVHRETAGFRILEQKGTGRCTARQSSISLLH